ncbi:MAG TPA: cupin domain-containing protein [Pyrinomonadaceae bacterium]|nr:cupin domain-containing protein [Pyrinomonadaceae bacterium]
MSYLDQPRINFTGRFFTNVSTINNDLTNYNPNSPVSDPGWNPNGVALFKFDSCTVTGVQAPGDHSGLIGAPLVSQTKPAPGKLVDLDPDQQSLSQVIGVALNLTTASGAGFQGVLGPCNLQDMWPSAPNPEGDAGGSNASSIFVSTLSSVQWTNADKVAALKLLRDTTQNSQLAIRFIVGSFFFADPNDPASGYGTLTGSIGPHLDGDPIQFARRRLMPPTTKAKKIKSDAAGVSGRPIHADFEIKKQALAAEAKARPPKFQACNFQLDPKNHRLSIDLVNAIPLASFAGPPLPVGQLRAVIVAADGSTKEVLQQPFVFTGDTNKTQGGIVDVPLTPDQSKSLEGMRAGIELQAESGGAWTTILAEHESGKFVNIWPFTARAVGGDNVTFELRAFQWGKPLANEKLSLTAESTGGTPASLVIQSDGSGSAVTDKNGRAVFIVKTPTSLDIPADRTQLDSLCYLFDGPWTRLNGGLFSTTFNSPDRAILPAALVVWSPYPDAGMAHPTWEGQVQPVFDEYMRMYPGMKQIMDLTQLSVVQAHLQALLDVFSLPFEAPHRMPVTRDLSTQKIEVIKTWLKNEIAKKKKGAFGGKTHGLAPGMTAEKPGSRLFTIAGNKPVALDDLANQLRQQITTKKLQLAEQDLGQQTGVKEALVVIRGHEDPHTHPESDLIIFVLEGGGYVQLSSGRVAAPEGSTVVIPRGVCHAYHNVSAHDSVLIATFSPTDSTHGVCPDS